MFWNPYIFHMIGCFLWRLLLFLILIVVLYKKKKMSSEIIHIWTTNPVTLISHLSGQRFRNPSFESTLCFIGFSAIQCFNSSSITTLARYPFPCHSPEQIYKSRDTSIYFTGHIIRQDRQLLTTWPRLETIWKNYISVNESERIVILFRLSQTANDQEHRPPCPQALKFKVTK